MVAVNLDQTILSRVERKRMEARARIISAAAALVRERGADAVTIQDITNAADVGHGSFYLHFKSKHEVLLPIMVEAAAALDRRLQAAHVDVSDPAQIMATSARIMGYGIVRDELWQWFLQHSGLPGEDLRRTFGTFSERDFQAGLDSGRFQVADPKVARMFAFGGYVSVLLASFSTADPEAMIDSAVEALLRALGVEAHEAARLVKLSINHI